GRRRDQDDLAPAIASWPTRPRARARPPRQLPLERPPHPDASPSARPRLLGVALFHPGVGVVVVAVALPEAELVMVEELEAAEPLGALPEVALRHEEAERVAVLELERLAVEGVGEKDVVVIEDRQRQVRGVALLGVGDNVADVRAELGELEDVLDRDAL